MPPQINTAEELARRWLQLWEEYLAALSADPSAAELMRRWTAAPPAHDPAAREQARQPGPSAGAPPAAGASVECDDAVAELSRRLGELERRFAALERGARRNRRRDPGGRD